MSRQIRMPPAFSKSNPYARDWHTPWTERPRISLRVSEPQRPPSPVEIPEENLMTFGKYHGKSYEFVRQNDVGYSNWCLKQMNTNGGMLQFQLWLKRNTRKVACECCNGSGLVDVI